VNVQWQRILDLAGDGEAGAGDDPVYGGAVEAM
jgi:hypothetical protein